MPVLLDNLNAAQTQANVKIYKPTFFDKILTGKGKVVGVLNANKNPINITNDIPVTNAHIGLRHRKITNGNTETHFIPVNTLTISAWANMNSVPKPDPKCLTKIAEYTQHGKTVTIEMAMPIHSLTFEETDPNTNTSTSNQNTTKLSKIKKLTVCYQFMLFSTVSTSNSIHHKRAEFSDIINGYQTHDSVYGYKFTCSPLILLNSVADTLAAHGFTVDAKAILDYITDYSVYDHVLARVKEWNEDIDKTLDIYFQNIASQNSDKATNEVVDVIRRLEMYNIPLDLYKNIYSLVAKHFNKDDSTVLCKQNLNLLLSDTLNNLNMSKSSLTTMPTPAKSIKTPANFAKFSHEQQKAITATDPLVLVQAGAGTGKSTVILGRIDYMIAAGVNPEDITVLSFTNAAADHIKEKNSNVHSFTIASMIHSIYELNFPSHELSNIDTVINSLMIYFPHDPLAEKFRKKLIGIKRNDRDSFTSMNNFIEYNFTDVMHMLDTIQQTSLELEIIICYQQIDSLKEPADITSKYLIIDEVQDNSIFEFIYTLKYVDKHKESLFIVGDCSQTLYEFRASNPKALNILEGSGIFTAYQLQVNYRSTQEILDFANVVLDNIEANQYANIQLRANSLNPVTASSFQTAVNFQYAQMRTLKDFNDAIGPIFANNVFDYVKSKLDAGEKVAFLAYTRNHVNIMKETLEHLFPDKNIISIVPDRMHNSTIFSEFIKNYWNEIKFAPTQSLIATIAQCILHRLPNITRDEIKSRPFVQKLINQWAADETMTISAWVNQYLSGQMSLDDLMQNTKENMLQFEIKYNALKQALLSQRNNDNKNSQDVNNADLILSTIHSAKGLEFDNVVVIYRSDNFIDEETKRMYYVAFTRAMKSEYILAYGTAKSPQIEADYNTIVSSLNGKAPKVVKI